MTSIHRISCYGRILHGVVSCTGSQHRLENRSRGTSASFAERGNDDQSKRLGPVGSLLGAYATRSLETGWVRRNVILSDVDTRVAYARLGWSGHSRYR
jgi:hypothetical protein